MKLDLDIVIQKHMAQSSEPHELGGTILQNMSLLSSFLAVKVSTPQLHVSHSILLPYGRSIGKNEGP